jgi:hypothetical protein
MRKERSRGFGFRELHGSIARKERTTRALICLWLTGGGVVGNGWCGGVAC